MTVNHDVAGSNPASGANGLFVKWLRHRPFTAGSGVRIPHRSPSGRLAQLGERLPYKQNVGSSILSSPTKTARWCSGLTCRPVTAEIVSSNLIRVAKCGSSSVVEHNLAKVGVAGSSPVFRSIWRHSQAVRQRTANPSSPVRIRVPPPLVTLSKKIYR